MPFVAAKIAKTCQMLEKCISQEICKIEDLSYQKTEYKKGHTPPKRGYNVYEPNTHLAGVDTHYWFKFNFEKACCGNAKEGRAFLLRP